MTTSSLGRRRPEIGVVAGYLRELRRQPPAPRRPADPQPAPASRPRVVSSDRRKPAPTA